MVGSLNSNITEKLDFLSQMLSQEYFDKKYLILLLFLMLIFLTTITRLVTTWLQASLAFYCGETLGNQYIAGVYEQEYQEIKSRRISDYISGITVSVERITKEYLFPALIIYTSLFSILFISAGLLFININITFICIIILIVTYGVSSLATKKIGRTIGARVTYYSTKSINNLKEFFSSIKEIKIYNAKEKYLEKISMEYKQYKWNQILGAMVVRVPRHIIEAIILTLLVFLSFYFQDDNQGAGSTVPEIGAFAFALIRLLPVAQQFLVSINLMNSCHSTVTDFVSNLEKFDAKSSISQNPHFHLDESLTFENVTFSYHTGQKSVFTNLNLSIPAKTKLAITGRSGVGKSSLSDLVSGFIIPDQGKVLIDGVQLTRKNVRYWHNVISLVSQDVVLMDTTVAENVAFGVDYDDIDHDRLLEALEMVKLKEHVCGLPLGIQSV